MIRILSFLVLAAVFLFASCGSESDQPATVDIVPSDSQPITSVVDSTNVPPVPSDSLVPAPIARMVTPMVEKKWDLRPEITRSKFEETQSAELEMLLIRPIYSKVYDSDEDDSTVIPQLTEGQRALYFFRKMDEAMSEGGIESLYKSNLPRHLSTIAQAFRGIDLPELATMAEKAAIEHKRLNSLASPDNIQAKDPYMNNFDRKFSKNHDGFYKRLEKYIREHPEEFVRFVE